jgi:hypothetical protein
MRAEMENDARLNAQIAHMQSINTHMRTRTQTLFYTGWTQLWYEKEPE